MYNNSDLPQVNKNSGVSANSLQISNNNPQLDQFHFNGHAEKGVVLTDTLIFCVDHRTTNNHHILHRWVAVFHRPHTMDGNQAFTVIPERDHGVAKHDTSTDDTVKRRSPKGTQIVRILETNKRQYAHEVQNRQFVGFENLDRNLQIVGFGTQRRILQFVGFGNHYLNYPFCGLMKFFRNLQIAGSEFFRFVQLQIQNRQIGGSQLENKERLI